MQEKLKELQNQYMNIVAELGDRTFRIVREKKVIAELEQKLHSLDAEYLKLEAEAKKAEEAKDKEEPKA